MHQTVTHDMRKRVVHTTHGNMLAIEWRDSTFFRFDLPPICDGLKNVTLKICLINVK